ncbi:MAG: ABC transporter ATP-binding protein [Rhizobiales bacterium]|jgi:NitT/TauT family transport system ATP-binding protein|nr:ABC transporter ATP-binding protein [Hyphomicrobiales bacterium]
MATHPLATDVDGAAAAGRPRPAVTGPAAHGAGSILIDRVSIEFDAARLLVVDDVSLEIKAGEFVSIVGPSGCGKTTLLNLAAGLLPAEVARGTMLVGGKPPRKGNRDIAYMLARDALSPWRTALGNAELGAEIRGVPAGERRTHARELLDRVGLKGFEDTYPKALSQGMRQRVALARTFALDSPILLMDEPFGALDAQTKLQLEDVLLGLWQQQKRTVVFITHDLSEAVSMSDRVVVMSPRPARIIADIDIPLERPRSVRALQKDPLFHRIYAEVWARLEEGLTA